MPFSSLGNHRSLSRCYWAKIIQGGLFVSGFFCFLVFFLNRISCSPCWSETCIWPWTLDPSTSAAHVSGFSSIPLHSALGSSFKTTRCPVARPSFPVVPYTLVFSCGLEVGQSNPSCKCEAPSTKQLALSFSKQRLCCFRRRLWPGSELSFGPPCPHDYNDPESNDTQAAGGPLELSHRPGNSALPGHLRLTGTSPPGLLSMRAFSVWQETAEEMGIFYQSTQKVFLQSQLWSVVSHFISAHQNYPLTEDF